MFSLVGTAQSLEIELANAVSTDYSVCWVQMANDTFEAMDCNEGNSAASGTIANVISPPASGKQRILKFAVIKNRGASSQTVTVKKDISGTERHIYTAVLGPGEMAEYTDGFGWATFNASGTVKTVSQVTAPVPAVQRSPSFATANLTSAKTITSGSSFALYMGKAPRSLTSVVMRSRVTTAMATITWGEVAIAKGAPVVGGNPSLTVVGWTDVSASFNSTGQKSTTINVAANQVINEGDDLWLLIGNAATTALQVRAQSIADDLQSGYQASAAQRPSLIVGTPTSFTIEGATTLAAWLAVAF